MRWHVVVTGATTPTQLVHVSARLRRILALPWCDRLTVVVLPSGTRSPSGIPLTTATAATVLPADPRVRVRLGRGLRQWRFPADEWAVQIAVGAPGLVAQPLVAAANPGRRIPVVVTDQDLDSYATAAGPVPTGTRRRVEVERWALHCRTAEGWTLNEAVAEEFRARATPVSVDQRRVVLLQDRPDVPGDRAVAARRRTHVREVGRLVRRDGGQLVVRPHPEEDLARYEGLELDGITVLDPSGPAELDPRVLSAAQVIGPPSAALLTVAAVFARPARIVAPSVAEAMAGLTDDQRSLVATHIAVPEATLDQRWAAAAR